jgi:Uma2 family endonuclease
MAITPKLMTWREFAEIPDDGMQHELVRGVVEAMPQPTLPHTRLGRRIGRSLDRRVDADGLGEVYVGELGCLLTTHPDTVRSPDVAFLSAARVVETADITDYLPGSPDLVIEVISPNDRYTEVEEKVAEWLEHGARLVFVVNPRRRTVAVHRPGQPRRTVGIDDVLDGEDVVPGWSMAVRDLFA